MRQAQFVYILQLQSLHRQWLQLSQHLYKCPTVKKNKNNKNTHIHRIHVATHNYACTHLRIDTLYYIHACTWCSMKIVQYTTHLQLYNIS